jgi:hypothetical protein
LEKAYALSQAAADGTVTADELTGDFFKPGGAKKWESRYNTLQDLNAAAADGLTTQELNDILPGKKIKPIKGQEDLFRVKIQGNEKNNLMGVLQYDPETQTYKPASYIPTAVSTDSSFFSSPLGQILVGGGLSLLAGPLVGKFVSGIANPVLQGAARGALMGGLRSAVTGGDILKGVLSGGVGGGVGNYVGGLESVQNLRNALPGLSPYFDLPSAVTSGAANLASAGVATGFDPLQTLGAGFGGAVGAGVAGVPNVPLANANAAFSPNVQQALAGGLANFTNSLIQSGGDLETALRSGAISGAGGYIPTLITGSLVDQGIPSQTATSVGTGLTNYLIGSMLGNPNAAQIGVQSGLQTYINPYMNQLFGTVQNQINQALNTATQSGQQVTQQPAYMTYNPFSRP